MSGRNSRRKPARQRSSLNRRASEPHHEDADAKAYALDERLQQEVGETLGRPTAFTSHYNFVRIHRSLRVAPAMESTITERVWTMAELLA